MIGEGKPMVMEYLSWQLKIMEVGSHRFALSPESAFNSRLKMY